MNELLEIYSPLPPRECAEHLAAAIGSDRSVFVGSHRVLGKVRGSSFRLIERKFTKRSALQKRLTATMEPHGSGTVIRGSFGLNPFVMVFMFVWFAGVILIGGLVFLTGLTALFFQTASKPPEFWLSLVVPPGMLVLASLMVFSSRRHADDEVQFLTDFLRRTLDATNDAQNG